VRGEHGLPVAGGTPAMRPSRRPRASRSAAATPCIALLAVLTIPLRAQQPAVDAKPWSIPARGAALFTATGELRWTDAKGDSIGLERAGDRFDPVLFAADVAPDGRALSLQPWSLQSLGPWLAFDLSWRPGDRVDRVFPRVDPFGEVFVHGEAHALADGRHELVVVLRRRDIAPRDDDAEFLRVERHYLGEELGGRLIVRRRLDVERGGVQAFEWEVDGHQSATGGTARARYSVSGGETWRLLETVVDRYTSVATGPGFAARIETARAFATMRLRQELQAPDVQGDDGRGNVQGPSLLALRLAALARSGVRSGDADAAAAFVALQQRELKVPSGIACAILATGWLHAPPGERQHRLGGAPPGPRDLPAPARRYVGQLVRQLLALRRTHGELAFWPFAADVLDFEALHTWLAVVALDEAVACGIEVRPDVFAGVAAHLCEATVDGGWTNDRRDHRGWCTAAATAGALAALQVCARRLPPRDPLQQRIRGVSASGLDVLERLATARWCGADLMVLHQYHADYALALAVLGDELPAGELDALGARDPYFEAALVQQLRQRGDGAVPPTALGTAAALWLWRPCVTGPTTPGSGSGGDQPRKR